MEELGLSTQCPCGSNLPLWRCHGRVTEELLRTGTNTDFPGPAHFKFEHGGFVYRIVRNSIFRRDKRERLHAFTVQWLYWKFGEKWFERQERLPEEDRHVVAKWMPLYWKWNNENYLSPLTGRDRKIVPPGFVNELLSLASDVYTLLIVDALPNAPLNRLRNYDLYQGARYEVAIGAALVRAGFQLKWKKPKRNGKVYEFDATHKVSKETIAVEAKSKHRKGAIHQTGETEGFDRVWKDFIVLYSEAVKTRPNDRPFAVFVDLNLSHDPTSVSPLEDWSKELLSRLANHDLFRDEESPEHTKLAITNSAWHYDGEAVANKGRYLLMRPMKSTMPIKVEHTYAAIVFALNSFGTILDD